ncbi:response regulator [Oscillatoria salina]|uniref:response regulator n=1 Tax=Oscillatoria salina TaxID=331517 RepID=UPI0013B8C4EE|nr:response regulator [Oscillatoria salina]MBZ8180885.1 response regulator [Oscillatoria salina IIICB1]NET87603.1 response regulator [Kamptonema sp. SIO1D9]
MNNLSTTCKQESRPELSNFLPKTACDSHILVVDDNEDNLLLLIFVLEQLNCSLITANKGQTALQLAETHQPDLILLDILLPDLDGVAVISQLRKNPKTRQIPVIAVTALATPEDKEKILAAGCNEYISKPFMIDEIEAKVKHYLNWKEPIS